MFRKAFATATLAAAALMLATLGIPAPSLAQQAAREAHDATPYDAWKAGNQACNALQYLDVTPAQVARWLHVERGYSTQDARLFVRLAVAHHCGK